MGEHAVRHQHELAAVRQQAEDLFKQARDTDSLLALRKKALDAVRYERALRCALPSDDLGRPPEAINASFPLPALPTDLILIASDGSQIGLNRHAAVEFCLINVGVIQMRTGGGDAPSLTNASQLFYGDALVGPSGGMNDEQLALERDVNERVILAELVREAAAADPSATIVTFTDGPLEIWGAKDPNNAADFKQKRERYQAALRRVAEHGALTAGYIDKPAANLVLRLLEISMASLDDLLALRDFHPLSGVTDRGLFAGLLPPGARSAVFTIQSQSANDYTGDLALHFFYLNVSANSHHPWIARVEIPAWVAADEAGLNIVHATLIEQCRILGDQSYPYLLHRAHETAVVTLQDSEQVTTMIIQELLQRGVPVDHISFKQAAKNFSGRGHF
jgi:hypothetical protein